MEYTMDQFLIRISEDLPFLLILILCAGLFIVWQWAAVQRRRMAHAERLAALEKSAPIPPESGTNGFSHRPPLTRDAYLLRGLCFGRRLAWAFWPLEWPPRGSKGPVTNDMMH
jgi:hypothetical protein